MGLILITEAELRKILKQLGWSGTRLSKRAWSMLIRYYAKQGYNVNGTFVPRRSCLGRLNKLNSGPPLGGRRYERLSKNALILLRYYFTGMGYRIVLPVRDRGGRIAGLALI